MQLIHLTAWDVTTIDLLTSHSLDVNIRYQDAMSRSDQFIPTN